MYSCKQSYKYINILHVSKLTAQRNTRKAYSNCQSFNLSNIRVFKHTKKICKVGTY